MSFPLDHWKDPRATIACAYVDNDMGYCTHGAHAVADVLQALDIKPSDALRSTILDFGSGTGRISRILSRHFLSVVAYDPSPQCMERARKEQQLCFPLHFPSLTLAGSWDQVPPYLDFACAVNVFEHLDGPSQGEAMLRVSAALRPGGRAVLWLSRHHNAALLKTYPMKTHAEGSTIGIYVWTKG